MKIKFNRNTYIRLSPDDMDMEPIGVIYRDVVLEVDKKVVGATKDFVSDWYADSRGWYYWGGGIEELEVASDDVLPVEEVSGIAVPEKEEEDEEEEEDRPKPEKAPAISWQDKEKGTAPEEDEKQFTPGSNSPEVAEKQSGGDTSENRGIHFDRSRMNWGIEDLELLHFFWNRCGVMGEGVSVAVLDTGADEQHPDFEGGIKGKFNFAEPRANDITDRDGRGTRCAGLIGARGRDSVWGVAPRCNLYIGKILSRDTGFSYTALLSGMEWAMEKNVDIIFIGLDLRKYDLTRDDQETFEETVNLATGRGILVIAPAGDSNASQPEGRYPSCLENCLSIGAYDKHGSRYASSIRSFTLDNLAPGEDLLTTATGTAKTCLFSGSYAAAAFAAGCMALVINANNENSIPLQALDLLKLARSTATPKKAGIELRDFEYGYGLINPVKIFKEARKRW